MILLYLCLGVTLACPPVDTVAGPLPDTTEVVILGFGDPTITPAPSLGEISYRHQYIGDDENMALRLRSYALSHGANLVRITVIRHPTHRDVYGLVSARIYRVPDVRLYEPWIDWSANRRLTLTDFKGVPSPPGRSHSDCTFYLLPYTHETSDGWIYTRTRFYTHSSWIESSVHNPREFLQHEQGEFDLCESFRRKLDTFIFSSAGNFYREARRERAYKQIYAEYLRTREQYDSATRNGIDSTQQALWTRRIAAADFPDVPVFTHRQLDRQAHTLRPTDGLALIYVIRPNHYNTSVWKRMVFEPYVTILCPYFLFLNYERYSITFDSVVQGPIGARKFVYRYVRPGDCSFNSPSGASKLTIHVEPGKVYYIKMKLIEREFFAGVHPESELLSERKGRRWLRKCHLSSHWELFILPVVPDPLESRPSP
jgi:hypothetical protein